ncbi:MAG: NAD(P)-dependent oxidoreductase [Ruminococcaceae bacterium]|nr:NAD(P)-dependent oxidoreductase [Oscillospiraceae bacterium]
MRAVVSGATGAVGMALISQLVSKDVETTVLCREGSVRTNRIRESELVKKVNCSLERFAKIDLDGKYDVFFHLAWAGTTGKARNDMYLQNDNVRYTLDAVELAARSGCKTFVGVGSQAEYGSVGVKLEPMTPTFPEIGYGMAKLAAGQMSRVRCRELGIRHVWARILSVYGPYDGEGSLVSYAIDKLARGERASFTKAEQTWDYLYSADAARALFAIAERGRDGGVYCLGSEKAQPLYKYIEAIRDAVAPDALLGFGDIPYPEGQVMYLCADISELTRDTGFFPLVSFEDGIRETVKWYYEERGDL